MFTAYTDRHGNKLNLPDDHATYAATQGCLWYQAHARSSLFSYTDSDKHLADPLLIVYYDNEGEIIGHKVKAGWEPLWDMFQRNLLGDHSTLLTEFNESGDELWVNALYGQVTFCCDWEYNE